MRRLACALLAATAAAQNGERIVVGLVDGHVVTLDAWSGQAVGAFSSGASRLRRPPRPPPADPLGGGGPLTPERLREYETAIAEYEALRAEAARLRAEAAALADPPPEAEEEEEEEAGAAVARAARRRVLAAAAAHLRARRAELLPAVRAAAAALGEARSDLASVASAFEGGA